MLSASMPQGRACQRWPPMGCRTDEIGLGPTKLYGINHIYLQRGRGREGWRERMVENETCKDTLADKRENEKEGARE